MIKPASVHALLHPKNVVLVGVSDRPGHWSPRVWGNLRRLGFAGNVYAINPGRSEIWGAHCYPTLAALPEPPDHVALFVPADTTLSVLEEAATVGARSATLYAAGFGEGGETEGRARAVQLSALLARTGIAAAGPNCMGLACGASGFVTLADETLQPLARGAAVTGAVAVITQSGMLATSFNRALNDRGLAVSHLISCGNQIGLTLADYIDHLADAPGVRVILCYIEALRDAARFLTAAAKARANGRSIVAVKIGGGAEARAAALAHTGALVGNRDAFDALARNAGIVRVDSLEDLIEAAELLVRIPNAYASKVAFMTNSGALKSLMTEAAGQHGVGLATLARHTTARLCAALGPDASPSNPLDTRRTLPTDTYMASITALAEAPEVDLVVTIEELPREAGVARKVGNLRALEAYVAEGHPGQASVAVLSPLAFTDTDYMRQLRAELPHLPLLRNIGTTFRVLAALQPSISQALPATPGQPRLASAEAEQQAAVLRRQAAAITEPTALDEVASKRLIAAYGIALPDEAVVHGVEAAVVAAERIGYPVVMKAVSAAVPHKSDAGLVLLGLDSAKAVRGAARTIAERCARLGVDLDALLVAAHIKGGTEMVLGVNRDPEMGPVLMVGMGGVWLELFADVAVLPPAVNDAIARRAIASLKAHRLLEGYRGAPARDIDAFVAALVALGRLVGDLGDIIHSIDINPLLVRDRGRGAVALDALVVLRPSATSNS